MRRLLVTGGAGFIGGNFVHYWLSQYPADTVVVLDALTYAGNRSTLDAATRNAQFKFVHGDIADQNIVSTLLSEHNIDTIVHFAAESHVDRSIVDPGAFVRTNVIGTQILLDAAMNAWRTNGSWKEGVRFHHVSTDEVYGSLGPDDAPFSEMTPYSPNSPYAASKAGSDHLVRAYSHTYGLPASISNCSNNYGPFQFPEKLIPLMIVNVLDGKPLPVYGDGQQVRDWLFVTDHCVAIDCILQSRAVGHTFNIGGRAEHANLEIVRSVCELVDTRLKGNAVLRERFPNSPASRGDHAPSLIRHVADRPGHDRRYAINPQKISRALGFEPRESLSTGLGLTVDWYLAHHEWWRAVQDGSYRQWMESQYGSTAN